MVNEDHRESRHHRGRCRRAAGRAGGVMLQSVSFLMVTLSVARLDASEPRQAPIELTSPAKVVERTAPLSPPALAWSEDGSSLQVAWFEQGQGAIQLKLARVGRDDQSISDALRIDPDHLPPAAIHQAPGLATGHKGAVYVTWSSKITAPGALFASDLQLAGSPDSGHGMRQPQQVNDDHKPISHSFEDVVAGDNQSVYVAWLDGRHGDRSGAGIQFAASHDGGASMGGNITIDGMACPCCRPSVATAPDGTVWVAWRKTFDGNVRDIVVASSSDQGRHFSPPTLVHKDGWVFDACPHRGPSLAFDRDGRLYVGWYTEGVDEQPRIFVSTSDDRGQTFSAPVSLHTTATSLPDHLHMAVHPAGAVLAVWEEVTGVRKRVVMRVSTDRGRTFGPEQTLSDGTKAEHPTVALHPNGSVAIGWMEHAFPHNRIVVRQGRVHLEAQQ